MENIVPTLVLIIVLFVALHLYKKSVVTKRAKLIDRYPLPPSLPAKIREKYPHLSDQELEQVMTGLREYFHLCNIAGKRMVSMPSQSVDVAWHEFILFTRKYEQFCMRALGRFLHHTPAEAMESPTAAQAGIKTAWKISCFREKIQPKSASKLPLLFAMDAALKIPDGFKYSLDCSKPGSHGYCAGHIGCGSGCGGCSGDSSGCSGGGCGGD
ncbi:glycine-rich domain-containing protein [Marinobacter apostichopi]|uniref:glycine-rich domain-containing protein n=1 Tax=Marinobacter apostichopi TaxID=3035454 RepID=UPI00257477AE|nr:hypothetical protein [Marinobacter sp. LA51]